MLAPWDLSRANPDPSKPPHIVNNSWRNCQQFYNSWYQGTIDAWHAAGIYPVFSNGNAGNCGYSNPPGLNTVGNPGRYGNVTGVGSTGRSDGTYADYSNWGLTVNPKLDFVLTPAAMYTGVGTVTDANTGWPLYAQITIDGYPLRHPRTLSLYDAFDLHMPLIFKP
jgi:subtilisin family serine protease